MPTNTNQSLWRKRVWIPLWVIDLAINLTLLIFSAVNSYNFSVETSYVSGDLVTPRYGFATPNIFAFVAIGFSAVSLIFAVTEIILFAKYTLRPDIPVAFNSVTTLMWLYLMAQSIANVALGYLTSLLWPLVIVLFVVSAAKLTYSCIVFHWFRIAQTAPLQKDVEMPLETVEAAGALPYPVSETREEGASVVAPRVPEPAVVAAPAVVSGSSSAGKTETDNQKFLLNEDAKSLRGIKDEAS